MTTRILNLAVSCIYVALVLFYRGNLLEMSQRASNAGVGVGHSFSLGAYFGAALTISICFFALVVKDLISCLRARKKGD